MAQTHNRSCTCAGEFLGGKVPRSTLYHFLRSDLGLQTESKLDQLRCAMTTEEVIAICLPLQESAAKIQELFATHQTEIQQGQLGN